MAASDGAVLAGDLYPPASQPDSADTTLILAHGWTLNRTVWSRLIEAMHERTELRIVAYDQRGHGRSSAGTGRASIARLGGDLAAIIAHAAPTGRLVLCGHSMGGMAIMAYAGQHPDEVAARVAGVALLGTAASDVRRPGVVGKVEMGVMHLAARGPRRTAGLFVNTRHTGHLNFGDGADAEDMRLVRNAIAGTSIRDMGSYFRALQAHDERESLAALASIPTTIMVGEKDRLTPVAQARALHDGIPGSTLIELAGRGHMLSLEACDEVVEVLCALAG